MKSNDRVTIPPGVDDPNFRYTMPKMELQEKNHGNSGFKTNITNLDKVSAALRVPAESILKYFASELGASKDDKTTLKGKFNYATLLGKLDKFIRNYVLCLSCGAPEVRYINPKKKILQ